MKHTILKKLFFLMTIFLVGGLFSNLYAQKDFYAYLFAYFKGEGLAQGEQIYFAVSKDGLHWTDLNEGNPVLVSTMGEKGLRDPFIMRSADDEKFYVIATDLKIYGNGNWTAAQTTGSKSIMVWESNDLINWSDQRMCQVAPEGAGCTWAPKAFYDEGSQNYVVFWASKIPNGDNTHRIYYCITKDFIQFSETKVWSELRNQSGKVISEIDATVIKVGDTYYRFMKNEATEAHRQGMPSSGKYIIMEKSTSPLGNWEEVNTQLSQISGVEGPTCFKFNNEDRWCLFIDDFGGKGYYPLISTDLSSGVFTQPDAGSYSLPSVMRHGSVVNLTRSEYYNLVSKYDPSLQIYASINPGDKKQSLEGWGISLCWWANMCGKWDDNKVNDLVDMLTSPDGLNYNIFRFNIGGGDDPSHKDGHMCNGKGKRAEMDGFKPTEYSNYDWNADPGQRKVLQKIHEVRPDAIFEAFSNSPPYWMTYSGCSAGNENASSDNLKPEYYGKFCDYLIDVCKHLEQQYGIEFKTLEPFNEPNTNYWGANGGQEGCHFSAETQSNLLRVLAPKLKTSGLKAKISACDETNVTTAISEFQYYQKEGDIIPLLGQLNVHTYSGNAKDKSNLKDLVNELGLPFWMSETGSGGTGIAGNLGLAQRMFEDLNNLNPIAWIDWQFVEEGNDQWCFVKGNFSQQTYTVVKNYYIRMQVTRFIKKGYTFLATGRNDLLAAISPDNSELDIVMLNTGTDEKKVDIDLFLLKGVSDKATLYVTNSNLDCEKMADLSIVDKTLSYEMGGQEIATAILSVNAGDGVQGIQKNIPYMIVPRVGSSVIKKVGDGLQLAVFSPSDKLQQWIFEPLSNGKYTISLESDGKRLAMTENGSYYLALTELKENDPSQQFELLSIGDDCYKLKSASNEKLFDLEGEATTVNTKVGLWQAGTTGANAHREWYILPVPFAQEGSENVSVTELSEEDNIYFYSEESLLKMIHLSGKPLDIAVYNLSGTLLYSKADVTNRSLEISLPKGVYLVKCTSMQKRSTMKVVVR
ncbi:MAG TPA: glycoside hydrolase [Paludibacteraceae bacterium]|mgnify:CR=1 FL=1|nr:glycoside hydrolase [Paludibacteraceae bacterium]